MMKPGKIFATVAIAGGLLAGAAGVASADDGGWGYWQPGHGDGHGWRGHDGDGGWNGGGNWGGGPAGGWNGGWEPWGGICIFGACV